MDFLNVKNRSFLLMGISNKKSIAFNVAKTLVENGANVIISVQNEEIKEKVDRLFHSSNSKVIIFDVLNKNHYEKLKSFLLEEKIKLSGFLHSLAFARFENGEMPQFHEVKEEVFNEAMKVSAFSFIEISNALKDFFVEKASCVTVSISSTKVAAYGYLGPIKAMLESFVPFLAKSFSKFSEVRFNAVCAGPLKTSASAGIPNYIDNYLFSEKLTLRKRSLVTEEVANTICFLLSERSSGINGEKIVVDSGMGCNYFDEDVVKSSLNF